MNTKETVDWFATAHSGTMYPKRKEELDGRLPYFEIVKNAYDRYDVVGYNYERADNAPRMPYLTEYLKHNVLPFLEGGCDATGCYPVQLHDSYTYLNDGLDYKDVFTFAKYKDDKGPVLLPDMYMIGNWGNAHRTIRDTTPWNDKKKAIVWKGTTTGKRVPKDNERIKMCLWALDKKNFCEFNITNVAQMEPDKVLSQVPRFPEIYGKPMNQEEQMKYRYHLVMDGNTCSWNVWNFLTKSLVFKHKSREMLWYYPLLRDKTHFVEVEKGTIENAFRYYENNGTEAQWITCNANRFSDLMFNPYITQQYTISLFESIAHNSR